METFTGPKSFVHNPNYDAQRQAALSKLDIDTVDPPIVDIVSGFITLPCCFTLQSCYGHFLYENQTDPRNVEPLPISDRITTVEYRIAYIALCIQDSPSGRVLYDKLSSVPSIDPEYVQFGCAEWFWRRQINSYVLQVEPERFKVADRATLSYGEALRIERIRYGFFNRLRGVLAEISGIDELDFKRLDENGLACP